MPTKVLTPVGRIVWGNPLVAKQKTDNNNAVVMGKDGRPVNQWSFGLAIPKAECNEVFQAMSVEAMTVFPNGQFPADFAWKYKDGDSDVDDQGKPLSMREGYAGCYVFAIVTEASAPNVVRLVNGAYVVMTDGVKTGDYARVPLSIKGHTGKQGVRGSKAGLYLNPDLVEFVGYGQQILSGPDPMQLLGGVAVALPPGASATPVASAAAPSMPPGVPGGPMMPQQPVAAPQPGNMPVAAPQPGNMPVAAPQPGNMPGGVPNAGGPSMPTALPPQTAHHAPAAYHSNPAVAPAHDFVQNALGQQPVAAPQYAPQPGNVPRLPGQ